MLVFVEVKGGQVGNSNIRGADPRVIVVAGGAGYVGSVLTQRLLEQGNRVVVIDRCFFGQEPLKDSFQFGEQFRLMVTDTRSVTSEDLAGVDVVVDLAGLSNDPSCELDPGLTRALNVGGGANLLRAAKRAGVGRFVYQSSCSVYGASGDNLINENSALAPLSEYSRSKVEMEELASAEAARDFEVVITRPGTIYGLSPRMRFDLAINTMTLAALETGSVEIHGGGRQWRPFVHVTDVSRAIETIISAPNTVVANRVFNVGGNSQNYRIREIAEVVAATIPGTRIVDMGDAKDPRDYRCDFSRAKTELGFETLFTPQIGVNEISNAIRASIVDTGIKTRTVEYYRALWQAESTELPESAEMWSRVS